MECGKLTAKLRDAVPVIFIEDGKEIKRLKNIEIPDEIKKLQYKDFTFDVPVTGAITFKIFFEPGTLPDVWPELRVRKQRTAKEATPVEKTPDPEPATMEIEYHVTGDRRKELVAAISAFLEIKAEYLAMPTRAYQIGEYNGTVVLNEVSAFIWNKLLQPISYDDLLDSVLAEYDVDRETAKKDLDALLEKLKEYELLEN